MSKELAEIISMEELRSRAERALSRLPAGQPVVTPQDPARLLHELSVQKVELEMQNDELRQIQLELEESRERYQALYDEAPVVYLTLDRTGKILQSNLAASTLLGVDPQRLRGKRLSSFMTAEDGDRFHHYRRELFSCETKCSLKLELRTDRGEVVSVHLESVAFRDSRGKPTACRCAIMDLTERKNAEAGMRERGADEERKRVEEVHHGQRLETLGALASEVGHEFNNILQALVGLAHGAADEQLPMDQAREYMRRVENVARSGCALTHQLTDFSRKQDVSPSVIPIDAVLENAVVLLEHLLPRRIRLDVKAQAPNVAIWADRMQIKQILLNLGTNSRDAMPAGGTLRIRTRETYFDGPAARRCGLPAAGGYVELLVEDTGDGMDEATRARIFEPFFTTKAIGTGTGLGLSTVFAITQELGGHVDVESEINRGTAFRFYFPRCEQEVPRPAPITPRRSKQSSLPTILLVDSHNAARRALGELLQADGYRVLAARTPSEARQIAAASGATIDLLLTDVRLAEMNGEALAWELSRARPGLPVLFMSGSVEPFGDARENYVSKPIDLGRLTQAIQRTLGRRKHGVENELGDCE